MSLGLSVLSLLLLLLRHRRHQGMHGIMMSPLPLVLVLVSPLPPLLLLVLKVERPDQIRDQIPDELRLFNNATPEALVRDAAAADPAPADPAPVPAPAIAPGTPAAVLAMLLLHWGPRLGSC